MMRISNFVAAEFNHSLIKCTLAKFSTKRAGTVLFILFLDNCTDFCGNNMIWYIQFLT